MDELELLEQQLKDSDRYEKCIQLFSDMIDDYILKQLLTEDLIEE